MARTRTAWPGRALKPAQRLDQRAPIDRLDEIRVRAERQPFLLLVERADDDDRNLPRALRPLQADEEIPGSAAPASTRSRMMAAGCIVSSAAVACAAEHAGIELEGRVLQNLLVEEAVVGRVFDDEQRQFPRLRLSTRPAPRLFPGRRTSRAARRRTSSRRRARSSRAGVPPSSSASRRASGSPSPVPRTRRCSRCSSWLNSSKILS